MIFFRILRKILSKYTQLKYRRVIQAGPQCILSPGLKINHLELPSRSGRERLSVILEGRNGLLHGAIIQGTGTFSMGENSYLGEYSVIGCNERIKIGRDVMIAQAVSIRDTDHVFSRTDIPMNLQGVSTLPVVIEDNVWIGHGATILKGVKVGTGAVVAAGAVVVHDVEPYSIVGGVPAKEIASRGQDQTQGPAPEATA